MTDHRPIGFWLALVSRLIEEQFAETLEEHGVTRRQWQLMNVMSNGPATVETLDAAISPFLATGTGESSAEHLSELIESGWVDATPDGYEITDRGRVAYEKLAEVVQVNRDRASAGISSEDYEQTLATLERMAQNLGYTG